MQGAIGIGFASHWMENWCKNFKSITKHTNRDCIITFDSHLKTAQLKESFLACTPSPRTQAIVTFQRH